MNRFIGYIYSITNLLNGHTYIGKTNDVERRWKEHRYGHGGTAILNKAFKKYSLDNFLFDVVAEIPFDSIEELNDILAQLEVYYIELYDTFHNGYNATIGGDGTSGYKQSSETTEKIRRANLGRIVSKETREKISASKTGIGHTKETKEKISKALLHRDPAIYEKMANKLRGRIRDHEMIMKAAKKRRKPILQYDLQGNFIKEYPGIKFIDGFEGKNISACCHGKLISTQGYIWRFKEGESYPRKINVSSRWDSFKKPVLQYDLNDNFIAEYVSIAEAARVTGLNNSKICQCLKGTQKATKGFIWKYKEEKEVENAI